RGRRASSRRPRARDWHPPVPPAPRREASPPLEIARPCRACFPPTCPPTIVAHVAGTRQPPRLAALHEQRPRPTRRQRRLIAPSAGRRSLRRPIASEPRPTPGWVSTCRAAGGRDASRAIPP